MDFRRFRGTDRYLTSSALESAVNCALALERPLLVRGEPGTGKTQLAEAIAGGLGLRLIHWPVKSTTRAQDGLYVYDTVQRLYDSRFGDGDVRDIRRYIKLGPLGEAFASKERRVLLIDEVDKADLEFPNDLLHELDRMRFRVGETGDEVVARERPVVVITSNAEKELPDAFLRRCVFHFIEFPEKDLMARIVRVHHPDLDQKLLDQALRAFYALREVDGLRKRPSTSELIDWIAVLRRAGIASVELEAGMPFLGALLKREQDLLAFAEAATRGRRPRACRLFVPFLYELRDRGVKVGAQEALSLAEALGLGLHKGTLDGFYEVARALCVHREQDLDAFDRAFAHHFRGVPDDALALTEELLQWLEQPAAKRQLTELEKQILERLDLAQARERLRQRLLEQRERHDGGNRWVGAGGGWPHGGAGTHPTGIKVGNAPGGRGALELAGERHFRDL